MADAKNIKVCLTNKGEDTESPWAIDLGAVGSDGSRKVKLVNVPFMHAKPTWGDTIIVKPDRNGGPPVWDREGVPWKQIATKIVEDGGRWAMIVDYLPTTSADEAFAAIRQICDEARIVCEGAWGPRDHDPGRVYLAVQKELNAEQVMGLLIGASLPTELIQIHPEPKKRTRAQTVVGISDDAGRPPAAKPTTSEASQASKSAAKKTETSQAMKASKSEASAATRSGASNAAVASKADVAKPAPAKAATKPAAAKAATKPAVKAATKPAAAKAATKPAAAKAATKPAAAKAATKSPAKPAPAKPAAKPAAKATSKTAAKPAAKPAPKKPAKKK